jgi:serine/threonine protein kinase
MGVVYKARQKTLNRFVALKLLAPERVNDATFAERFAHEAQALAALNHPHIVTVHDFGSVAGDAIDPAAPIYFLLMEFVDGVNLRQAMKGGRFTPEQALAVVPPVCEALQYAHEHGVVHRDIKPENLLLDKDGRVKIADFGIAKIIGRDATTGDSAEEPSGETAVSLPAGTPQYMAPEQKSHRATDHRADIYSLGVVLYELLTGELPAADKLQPTTRKAAFDGPLNDIVQRALHENPEMRYRTAAEMRDDLETILVSPSHSKNALRTSRSSWFGGTHRSPAPKRRPILAKALLTIASLLVASALAYVAFTPRENAAAAATESADFNTGQLSDSFADNVLFGANPYSIAPVGLNKTPGISLLDTTTSEGTLVYKNKSYDLSKLTSLEISCFFKRRAIGIASHALALGLVGTREGHLSGVKGATFVGVRLQVIDGSLHLQFQSKGVDTVGVSFSKPGEDLKTAEGSWYQLKVTFSRVDSTTIRATAALANASEEGKVGRLVGYFGPSNFGLPGFHVGDIMDAPQVWPAVRANGAGGAEALDNFEAVARGPATAISEKTSTINSSTTP